MARARRRCCQIFAALAASALAALDDYGTAALGYASGSVAGLALIVARVGEDGVVAVAWGMVLNGARRARDPGRRAARRERRPSPARAPAASGRGSLELARGVALPFALQALYLVCLRFATRARRRRARRPSRTRT